jgi:DNA modification methylase
MQLDVLYNEDCLEGMGRLPDDCIDAVVTDPPYGLAFMGRKWDYAVPSVAIWQEVCRVLKPGGHLLSFGSTRTYHRMLVNIEDAGLEPRDTITWHYGSGFPKSLDVSKSIDKDAGAKREAVGKNPSWRNPEANRLWRAREGRSDTGNVKA